MSALIKVLKALLPAKCACSPSIYYLLCYLIRSGFGLLGFFWTPLLQCISSLFSRGGRRDISLKKSPKTRTNLGRARLTYAPRAFLQFFHRDAPTASPWSML